jgi:glycosyltransferase involved in cell wall biosynthesis
MNKKKILFLSPYPYGKAASQRLKFEQYFSYLEENGFDLHTRSFVSPAFWEILYQPGHFLKKILYTTLGYLHRIRDLFVLHRYDIVYVHLWVTPLGPPVFEWLVAKLSKKLVYDIDDMIYYNQGSPINQLTYLIKGKNKPLALMRYADHVITCTPDLNEFARQYCTNCTDISSTLDTNRMQPAYRYTNEQPVTIGWTGTHSTVPYLYLLTPVFQQLAKERNYRLFVIGNFEFHMEGVNYEYVNWSAESEVSQLQQIDIGVYPLPSDAWVMGKSGLKALQYMTFAIPVVAQNVGTAINRIVIDGENGFLVSTPKEWLERLRFLVDHPEERKRVGLAARQTVVEKFSLEANKKTYLRILQSLST